MDEELRIALSKKEKVELFLSKLEKLKDEGSLQEAQYQDLKVEYTTILIEVNVSLDSIKSRLRKEFDKKAEEMENAQLEQELLQIRFNVREIRSQVYWAQVKPLRKKIAQLKKEVPKLRTLVNAESSDEIGGPAKVDIPKLKVRKQPVKAESQKKSSPKPKAAALSADEAESDAVVPTTQQSSPSKDIGFVEKLVKEPVSPAVSGTGSSSTGINIGSKDIGYLREKEERTSARLAAIVVGAALVIVILVFIFGRLLTSPADSKPPVISEFAVSSLAGSSATIEWETDERATSRVILRDPFGDSVSTEPDQNLSTKHSVKVTAIRPGIKYHLTVESADARGNEMVFETEHTFIAGDSMQLTISSVSISDITDTGVVIAWQTDKPANSQVMVTEVTTKNSSLTELRAELTTSHVVTVSNLEPGVNYTLVLLSKDDGDNQASFDLGKTVTTLASLPVGAEVGKRAPDFTLPGLDGKSLTLSSFQGKVVMINFWQRMCPACVREMPMIQSVFAALPGNEVAIIGVNVIEDETAVKSFQERWNLTFPIVLDAKREVANDYNVSDIPATFFLDSQGIIKEIKIGPFASAGEIADFIDSTKK
ncbi:redoxin domain-containing protein [Chloroflexota bacterium]